MAKKIFIILLASVSIICLFLYFAFLSIIPQVINSTKVQNNIKDILHKKTGYIVYQSRMKLKTNYNLSYSIHFDNIKILNKNQKTVLNISNLDIYSFGFKFAPKKITAKSLYFDKTQLIQKNNESGNKFKISNIPEININNSDITLENKINSKLSLKVSDLTSNNNTVTFNTFINTNFINGGIKADNSILKIDKDTIIFEKFALKTKNSNLNLTGTVNLKESKYNLNLNAKDLPINDTEKMFLYYIKQKEPDNKNFIENFDSFKGMADIDLSIKPNNITGNITLKDFSAKYIKFNAPLSFKNAVFNFNKDKILLNEKGVAGYREAYAEFQANDIFSPNREIKGKLNATVDNNLAKNSYKEALIRGKLPLTITYFIKNKEITVNYELFIPKNIDIIYKKTHIIPANKTGKLTAQTFKQGNIMYLKELNYLLGNNTLQNILSGNGKFIRKNNKYFLQDITIKTKDKTPVLFLPFLEKHIKDGYFDGSISYNTNNKLITGIFQVYDTKYKNFYIRNANISADNTSMKIKADGNYELQPFTCFVDLENGFDDDIVINDLNLYLKKYTIKRNTNKKPISKDKAKNIKKKINESDFTIKNAKITLGELNFKNIVLQNLALTGFIENSMGYFIMPDIKFANGLLKAEGIYDFKYSSSAIDFEAKAIDSNIAGDMIFNLKNQIEGLSNASMNVKTYDGLKFIDADANFSVEDGALTKIGSTEFIIKKSENKSIKLKLKDLINIDMNKMQALKSNLKGNFSLKNEKVKDIELYSQHRYLSVYATGEYNINSQNANINLLGRYNKNAQKGIRIVFIPLSWVTKFIFRNSDEKNLYTQKINKIPPVEARLTEQEIFSVKINGNLNNPSKLKVDLKSLK